MAVNICSISGQVASSSCPRSAIRTSIRLKKNEHGTITADSPYVISSGQLTSLCHYHKKTSTNILTQNDLASSNTKKKDTKTKPSKKGTVKKKKGE